MAWVSRRVNMAKLGRSTRWECRQRCLPVATMIVIGLLILATVTSRRAVEVRYSGRHVSRHFHVFGALQHLTDFPWNYATAEDVFLSNKTMDDVRNYGTKKLPQALIIGAKKAGTRALLEFIRVHPNVRAAGHEIHFFDKNFSEGVEWYREMMPTSIDGQITIEKTPSYFVDMKVPKRVYGLDPNMKIIIVFKDPVERAISDFTQSHAKHKRQHSFEESVFKRHDVFIVNETKSSISTGVYYNHLRRWMDYFRIEQFCFINGETLAKNPASELQKLQDFLDLKRVITEDHFYFNSTKGFPCLKKREARGTPHCLGSGKGRVHPNITSEAKVLLYEYFKPFNLKLYSLIGIDFGWESRSPSSRSVMG